MDSMYFSSSREIILHGINLYTVPGYSALVECTAIVQEQSTLLQCTNTNTYTNTLIVH